MHDTFRWLRSENRRGARRAPNLKWLLVPPVIALALFLGPFQSGAQPPQPTSTPAPAEPQGQRQPRAQPPSEPQPAAQTPGSARPELPGAWQVVSTLLGVLLLGGAAIVVLRRLQGRSTPTGTYLGLRQTLRLDNRHSVHAVEFDGQILLLGESDGNLAVLRSAQDPRAVADEESLAERAAEPQEAIEREDGAVPRDLVLPRPAAPTSSSTDSGGRSAAATAVKDFRALLRRARSGAAT